MSPKKKKKKLVKKRRQKQVKSGQPVKAAEKAPAAPAPSLFSDFTSEEISIINSHIKQASPGLTVSLCL